MSNIYATPEADLNIPTFTGTVGGSVEDAIAGNIEVGMLGTLGEAWGGMKGFKRTCILALLLYVIFSILAYVIGFLVMFGLSALNAGENVIAIIGPVVQVLAGVVVLPMFVGILILGMRHAENKPVSASMILRYFHKLLPVFLCYLIMLIMITLGLVLLVLPGIYLMVAYWFAMPLVVEKNMSPWNALETSRKAITRVWFRMWGLLLIVLLVYVLGFFTLTISWIWTMPWSVLTMSMVYTKLFGAEPQTLAD